MFDSGVVWGRMELVGFGVVWEEVVEEGGDVIWVYFELGKIMSGMNVMFVVFSYGSVVDYYVFFGEFGGVNGVEVYWGFVECYESVVYIFGVGDFGVVWVVVEVDGDVEYDDFLDKVKVSLEGVLFEEVVD